MIRSGFSLIEVIVASAVLLVLVAGLGEAVVYNQGTVALAGIRARASLLAEEGVSAARNMRDKDFSLLVSGTHGLEYDGCRWSLSGSSDMSDLFSRSVEISDIDAKRKRVVSSVSWQGPQLARSVAVETILTNWQNNAGGSGGSFADNLVVNTSGAVHDASGTRVLGITLDNQSCFDITLDRITLSWFGGNANNRILTVLIGGSTVWSGYAESGSVLDISNVTLVPQAGPRAMELRFLKSFTRADVFVKKFILKGATLNMTFTMTDGSSVTVSNVRVAF